jgi:hypothetical protein
LAIEEEEFLKKRKRWCKCFYLLTKL